MGKVFEQYAGILHQKYPNLMIEGDNYPPTTWKWQLAQFFSYAKMALIISIVASINPFNYIEMETPPIVAWAMENKLYACMMIFFISNAVETQLVSTGAFEIIDTHLKMNSGQETIDQQFNHQEL